MSESRCEDCDVKVHPDDYLCQPCADAVCESNDHSWEMGDREGEFVCEVCGVKGEAVPDA